MFQKIKYQTHIPLRERGDPIRNLDNYFWSAHDT